jgi:hypothetical protein
MAKFDNDKYYAPFYLAYSLLKLLLSPKVPNLSYIEEIIEPSAGNGSFIPIIKLLGKPYLLMDLYPDHPDIVKQNFFNYNPQEYKKRLFIGGPPFSGKDYYNFLRQCEKLKAEVIAFISPSSAYNKQFFEHNYDLIISENLGPTEFVNNLGDYTLVSVCLNIWIRKEGYFLHEEKIKYDQNKFKITSVNPYKRLQLYDDTYDYYIITRGNYTGKICKFKDLKNENYIGIKLKDESLRYRFNIVINNFFNHYNNIKNSSVSYAYMNKQKFLKYFNEDMKL